MIIFDLDLTLVDSLPIESLRAARKWRAVMGRVGDLEVYEGITDLLGELHSRMWKLAILTKSPDMVARELIKVHGWPIKLVFGYHQVRNRKPDPEGIFAAMNAAGARQENTFHVGDQPEDTQAARAANVTAIGAGWGLVDTSALEYSNPDQLFRSVSELRSFFLSIDSTD